MMRELCGCLVHTVEFSRHLWWDRASQQYVPPAPEHPARYARDARDALAALATAGVLR